MSKSKKDAENTIDGILDNISEMDRTVNCLLEELITKISNILKVSKNFKNKANSVLGKIQKEYGQMSDAQRYNIVSSSESLKGQIDKFKNYVKERVDNKLSSEINNFYEFACKEFCDQIRIINSLNKERKDPCKDALTKELVQKSVLSGCSEKFGELKIAECHNCRNPIFGVKLNEFLQKYPKYRIKEFGIPDDVLNKLKRMKEDDKCTECREPIKSEYEPSTISCDCIICSKCIVKHNISRLEKADKSKAAKFKFKCPLNKREVIEM